MQNIEKIYDQYFELVNRYLFSLTHNNDIAEEITQETFCRAVKKINTYNKKCKMSVWLCQIGKNIWYDQCRKNKRLKAIEDNKFINNNLAYTTEELVIEEEEKNNVV